MMDILAKVCALAVLCAICAMLLKNIRSELSFAVGIAGGVLLSILILKAAEPIIEELRSITEFADAQEYVLLMLKALGVAAVTQIAAGVCAECGERGLASGVELAGKLEILALCLPMLSRVIGYAAELISLG